MSGAGQPNGERRSPFPVDDADREEMRKKNPTALRKGQQVWLDGRPATVLYLASKKAAVVRFQGEQAARVVSMRKLKLRPEPQEARSD